MADTRNPGVSPEDKASTLQRALHEIRSLRSRVRQYEIGAKEPIAIVGVGLRFPGEANDAESFWQALANGVDAVTEVPPSRWSLDRLYDSNPDAPGKMTTRHGAFLEDPALFDADFWGVSPREATYIDPQHRLALEVFWEALENAGQSPAALAGSLTGVFLAMSNSDYGRLVFSREEEIEAYSSIGTLFNAAAGRISFALGLQGPCMAVDTACSGSLVAVHLACQSLRLGECGLALAGGVNLILTPEININFSKSRMMAADGRCKTFDAAADGYVRGEGCGVVVLKRLSDAIAAHDTVLAVIRGSAVNQDGRSGGLTVPNGVAQEALLRQALRAAGVQPDEIGYVEAHGTGTTLGDPIEARALAAVLGEKRGQDNPLIVGSVKTNIGHLEAAAGVAGLIKTALALRKESIPPHLHFNELNPRIDWGGNPVSIPVNARPWPRGSRARLAGVSSFGFSGTNAHVILEEAPLVAEPKAEVERPLHLLALSARSEAALREMEERYRGVLAEGTERLEDLCFTANAGRSHFEWRTAMVARSNGEMKERLEASPHAVHTRDRGGILPVFLFPGQGAQYAGMGRELYETHRGFRKSLDLCAELLKTELDAPLLDVLWGKQTELLRRTEYAQLALFAIEYALAELWRSWGVEPAAVLGHSVGEYTAACVAGVYSLESGLKLIAARGRLMQQVGGKGGMLAILASEATVREALAGLEARASIAAVNSPESLVISGFDDALAVAGERLAAQGVRVKPLDVSHGFHSPQMDAMQSAFEAVAGALAYAPPRIEMISSVTGETVGASEMSSPAYWRRQVSRPVLFQRAMETLGRKGYRVFVETGPGATLAGLGRQCIPGEDALWAVSLRAQRGEWEQILESVALCYERGAEIDWAAFDAPFARRRVPLPTYPFERRRYWIGFSPSASGVRRDAETEWEWVSKSARTQAGEGRLDLDVAHCAQRWSLLERLSSAYIVAALRQISVFQRKGERQNPASAIEEYGIRPGFLTLLGRWFRRLAREGILREAADGFEVAGAWPVSRLEEIEQQCSDAFTTDRVLLDYVSRCGEKLPAILTGKMSALETLFPNGEFRYAEEIYEKTALSSYFSSICRAVLEGLVRVRRGEALKCLEIGAGTGGTTAATVTVLPPESSYRFTDVSDIFLRHGERKFSGYPFLKYELFDVEKPEESAYAKGQFDVVVATNVLHATKDIRRVLATVRSLVAPGGYLILCEATRYLSWYDITTGLIEGWQSFEDELRVDHPLLAPGVWESLLLEAGFARVERFPGEGSPAEVLGQHVIVGRVPEEGVRAVVAATPQAQRARAEVSAEATVSLAAEFRELAAAERHERLVALVRALLAEVLRLDSPDRVERDRRLMDLGLDSLMALELRNRIGTALGAERPLSATLIFDFPTVDALAEHLAYDALGVPRTTETAEESSPELQARVDELAQMNEEDAEALLLKKMQSL